MSYRQSRVFVAMFAATGMAIAVAEYGWLEYAYRRNWPTPDWLFVLSLCLNPPSLLSLAFIDLQAGESTIFMT